MTWRDVVRLAVGVAIGLGLASVPFLHYGAHPHPHRLHSDDVHPHDR